MEDANGNTVMSASDAITLSLSINAAGGTLAGTVASTTTNGVATFSQLSINTAGTGYTLVASSPGLASATSNAFNIVPGPAAKLVFSAQPASAVAGASLGTVSAAVEDAEGNVVPTSSTPVTVALAANPSSGTLAGASSLSATTSNGVATFSGLSVNSVGTGYTLGVASTGLAGATSAAFNVSAPQLGSGSNVLSFPAATTGGTFGVALTSPNAVGAATAQPVQLYLCQAASGVTGQCSNPSKNGDGAGFATAANTFASAYTGIVLNSDGSVTASATVTTGNETVLLTADRYAANSAKDGRFMLTRTVSVQSVGNGSDAGFNSQFQIGFQSSNLPITQLHFFAPAIWYDQNATAFPGGIATSLTAHNYFYWRESRTSAPLVMMQEPTQGSTLTVEHIDPSGAKYPTVGSGANENSTSWLINSSVNYGSLGVEQVTGSQNSPSVEAGFVFPADEGDITYLGAGASADNWVRRSTPVAASASHSYSLLLDLEPYRRASTTSDVSDFPTAMRQTWNRYYAVSNLPIAADVSATAMSDGLSLLNTVYSTESYNSAGVPFQIMDNTQPVTVANAPYSFQMGYVGQQIPLAFQLLRDGTLNSHTTSLNQGQTMLNFWATADPQSEQATGLPLPWFTPTKPTLAGAWVNENCDNPLFIRFTGDGMEGMATAAIFALQHSLGKQAAWESFAEGYGQWLVSNQNSDGSFYRAYDSNGQVWQPTASCVYSDSGGVIDVQGTSKANTTFPIRFLVELWFATNNPVYRTAAINAGAYANSNLYPSMNFTGGITDRNALDRESGVQALHAALALYDLYYAAGDSTNAQLWLANAEVAAGYVQSWQFIWNYTLTDASTSTVNNGFAQWVHAGSRATSLAATGTSTGDIYLAIAAFDFYRMHLLIGEPAGSGPYANMAAVMANNTKLTTQLTGVPGQQFGWLYDGELTEAVTLTQFALTGVGNGWVPWLTNAQIDSLQRLTDTFGSPSVTQLLQNESASPSTFVLYRDTDNHQVYPAAGTIGW